MGVTVSTNIHLRHEDDMKLEIHNKVDSACERYLVITFSSNAAICISPAQAEQLTNAILFRLQEMHESEVKGDE